MSSLNANFDELLARLKHGRDFTSASFEPVYYLVFPPRQILEVKRHHQAWTARLQNDGWQVSRFSVADNIAEILKAAPQRKIWLAADRKNPLAWGKTNDALANYLRLGALENRLLDLIKSAAGVPNSLVLVTDLEALHPYLRIGSIEGQLSGEFRVPTVILYPGERTGKTRLKFLGFYPEDGNYRSVHVGG
jgi:hypothetical protein